jgi:CCR4-NOT transcription complex subunit 3
MAKLKQLQADVERKLKAVADGCDLFGHTLRKVQIAVTQTQREKLENELKKEIKKLQRLRETLKVWQNSADIKNKDEVLEARHKIEQQMMIFKEFEKENKIKAYSREGLAHDSKTERWDEEREAAKEWVKAVQQRLLDCINEHEAELELLQAKRVKRQQDQQKTNEIRTVLGRCSFHYEKLEQVLRALENDLVGNLEKLAEVKEHMESFLENYHNTEFIALDSDSVYDELELSNSFSSHNLTPVHSCESDEQENKAQPAKSEAVRIARPETRAVEVTRPEVRETKQKSAWKSKDSAMKVAGVALTQRPPEQDAKPPEEESICNFELEPAEEIESGHLERMREQFESSWIHAIRGEERALTKLMICKSMHQGHPSFPAQALLATPAQFQRFELDTLFFIFYHQQGSYPQYLAALELKQKGWKYHKKLRAWFQLHIEPNKLNSDGETGTYVYFDYENGWCQRIKSAFTFEHSCMEDELRLCR